jgi:cytochrome P450
VQLIGLATRRFGGRGPVGVLDRLRDSLEAEEEDYMRATITESLRLRPVVPLAGRRLAKELVSDGLTLPAGTDVTPAIWLAHTRADTYPDPFAFKPERLSRCASSFARC